MAEDTRQRLSATIAVTGFIVAIVTAIFYRMAFPIFDQTAMAWLFVVSVVSTGLGAGSLILINVWAK